MITRNPKVEDTHPIHGEYATTHHEEVVRYCDSCGDWLLYEEGDALCIRCDKEWDYSDKVIKEN